MSDSLLNQLKELAQQLDQQLVVPPTLAGDEVDCQKLFSYAELLLRWTDRVDLIAPAPIERILDAHILDSLAALLLLEGALPSPLTRVIDIGSGAGLPGIVVAIARPTVAVTLVEPREKRVMFLKEVRRALGLSNLQIEGVRIEALPVGSPTSSGVAMTRAVGMESVLVEQCRRLRLSHLGLMVGPSWDSSSSLPGLTVSTLPYSLPLSQSSRALSVVAL